MEELRFETWPRIDDAIESYGVFSALRDEGVIPANVRFQVSLPFRTSTLIGFKAALRARLPDRGRGVGGPRRARDRATDECDTGLDDLAIQWDVCWEVLDLEGVIDWTEDDAWERFAGPVSRITRLHSRGHARRLSPVLRHLPDVADVRGARHGAPGQDGQLRRGELRSPRRLGCTSPGPRTCAARTSRFFAPLTGLKTPDTRVYLGIVLPIDGADGLRRRHATASKYLDDFGVAMYCGFGRQPGADGMETMREHRRVVEAVVGAQAASTG